MYIYCCFETESHYVAMVRLGMGDSSASALTQDL